MLVWRLVIAVFGICRSSRAAEAASHTHSELAGPAAHPRHALELSRPLARRLVMPSCPAQGCMAAAGTSPPVSGGGSVRAPRSVGARALVPFDACQLLQRHCYQSLQQISNFLPPQT